MGRIDIAVPYVISKRSGYYWQPNKAIRALGFGPEALGKDPGAAMARARHLNEEVAGARQGKGEDRVPEGSVGWLIRLYQSDPAYTRLTAKTQRGYDQCLAEIEKWTTPRFKVGHVTRRAVRKWYREMYNGTPSKANAIMRVGRLLFQQAVVEGEIEANPFRGFKLTGTAPRHIVWPDEELSAFIGKAIEMGYPSMAMAVRIAADTGQREGDILTLQWTQHTGGYVVLEQSKHGQPVRVMALPSLADMLASAPRNGVQIIISEATGHPYKEDHFRHLFAKIRTAAGMDKKYQFMDLRRTAIVHLARGGATPAEIAHNTGHSLRTISDILRVYLPRDQEVADAGMAKLADYRNRTESVRESENSG